MRTVTCSCVLMLCCVLVPALAGATERVSLNGTWEVQRSEAQTPDGLTGEFHEIAIPGVFDAHDRRFAWCRRTFTVPEAWRGKHVFVHFDGVRYAPVVYVNGKEAGSYWGAWEPFEFDVTDLCKFGAENELMLRVSADVQPYLDAGIGFKPDWGPVQQIRDKVVVPMGFVFTSFAAIWDDVTLEARPDVYVDDVTVVTSVREKTITVKAAVRNLGKTAQDVLVGAQAMDGERIALGMGGQATSVPPGRTTTFTFMYPWPDPKLWQPDSPHLYDMDVRLYADDGLVDERLDRFGFREVWIDGDKIMLNGARVNLLGTARPGMSELFTREQVQKTIDTFRGANVRAVRLHANVWPEVWLDVADERGMLIIEESAYWCCTDQYATEDPAFFENFRKHWAGIIRRDKNHPSVVVHSIENELLLCAGPVTPENKRLWDLEKGLADVGRYVKQLDPTRPIMFNGDDDPGGAADIIDLHYPREPGRHALWPNEAYWLDGPTVIDNYPRSEWSWDKSKPLSVGEFQYNTGRRSAYALFGDAYARDPQLADAAQGVTWRMQVEAFRAQDVAAMCPYTPWEADEMAEGPALAAVRQAFEPNAAFVKEYDAHFFAGETVARTVNVYNDTVQPADLVLRWRMEGGPSGEAPVSLPPGEHKELTLKLAMPSVEQVTAAPLSLTVTNGGKVVYEAEHWYWVCPRRAPEFEAAGTNVAVLRGDGRAEAFLRSGGVEPTVLSAPAQIAGCGADVLVVEAHALDGVPAADMPVVGSKSGGPLVDFALAGGRVVVLEQDAYPPGMVPARLTGRATNVVFARSQLGRWLSDRQEGWFQFWRGDNLVSHNTIAKPSQGSFCVGVDAGGSGGLEDALLVAMPFGSGGITLCQLAVSEKLGTEPAAAMVLEGLVRQAVSATIEGRPVALLDMGPDVQAELAALGVVGLDRSDAFDATRHDDCGFVLAYAPAAHERAQELRSYVRTGGTVVLHGAQDAAALSDLLGRQVTLGEAEEGTGLLLAGPDALTDGLADADVQRLSGGVVDVAGGQALLQPASLVRVPDGRGCWIIDQVDWTGRAAGSAQAARYVGALLTNLGVQFRPSLGRVVIPGADLTGEGAEVSRYGDTAMLRASGTLSVTVRCASAGGYAFDVAGGMGRRATGRPQVRLLLDGVALEQAGEGTGLLTCRGTMGEGEHKLVLEYTAPEGAQGGGYGGALRVSSLTIQPE